MELRNERGESQDDRATAVRPRRSHARVLYAVGPGGYPLFLCGLPILQPRAVERYRIIQDGVCMWAVRSGLGVDRSGGSEMSRVSATGLAPAGPHKQYPQNGIHTQTHASRSTRGTPRRRINRAPRPAPTAARRAARDNPVPRTNHTTDSSFDRTCNENLALRSTSTLDPQLDLEEGPPSLSW